MKITFSLNCFVVCLSFTMFSLDGSSTDRYKANNADNLNSGSSWSGGVVPGGLDFAIWNSTVGSANTVNLGADLLWGGLRISNPGGTVTINGANTLTVGFGAFDMSTATVDLTLGMNEFRMDEYSGQYWNINAGRILTLNPASFTRGYGSSFGVNGAGTVSSTTLINSSTGIIAPWARIGTGISTKYATMDAGTVVPYTGTAAASAADVTDLSGILNYDVASGGSVGSGASFNTLRYTGGGSTISGEWEGNGVLNSGTGNLTFNGNINIGTDKELVLTAPDTTRSITISGSISDNAGGASGVTVTGQGRVDLSGVNTYTGPTAVSSGQLYIYSSDSLGSTNGETVIYENGSASTGGQLVLNNGLTLYEPLVITGPGDGSPWNQGLRVNYGGGSCTLAGPVILDEGNVRMTAGGNGTELNINAPVTRTSTGRTLLLGANSGGTVNVNALIDNNYGGVNLHNGPGLINFNVPGCVFGTLNVQTEHIARLGTNDAFVSSCSLAVGSNASSTSTQASGTFDMAGFNQGFNAFYGDGGANRPPSTRVVTNSSDNLSVFTSGNNNGGGVFNGVFAGNIAYVKNGSGAQYLYGPNAYTGGTTVNSGTLVVSNAVNHGSLEVNGGTFGFPPSLTVNGNLSGTGGTIDSGDASSTLTVIQDSYASFNGSIANGGSLVKNGSGILVLNGDNSYSGGTTVNEGVLVFGGTNAIPGSGSITTNPGGNLGMGVGGPDSFTVDDVDAFWAGTHPVLIPPAGTPVVIDTSKGDFTYPTGQSGSRSLIKTGPNALRLEGTNTYTGGTIVMGGILSIPDVPALPGYDTDGSFEIWNGATLAVGNGVSDTELEAILATTNFQNGAYIGFDTDTGDRTYASVIADSAQGVLGVSKYNVNSLYLNGVNSYDGITTVGGGRIVINNSAALGSSNGYVRVLRVGGTSGENYIDSTGQLQINGSAGDVVLDKNFYITGHEQYSYGGAIRSENGHNTINGWIKLEDSARISCINGTLVINGMIDHEGVSNPMLVFGVTSEIIVSNRIDIGLGVVNFHSSGTLVLTKNNNVMGDVQLQYGHLLRLAVDDAIPSNSRMLQGTTGGTTGRLDLNGFNLTIRSLRTDGNGTSEPNNLVMNGSETESSVLTVNQTTALNETYAGTIQDNVSLVKDGVDNSVLTLSGANTYTGTTTVRGGTLKVSSTGSLGSGCLNVELVGGTLDINNSSSIADDCTVSIYSGDDAMMNLDGGVNESVAYLSIDGEIQPFGTYGSSESSATHKNDTFFSGTGMLTVRKDNRGTVIILR